MEQKNFSAIISVFTSHFMHTHASDKEHLFLLQCTMNKRCSPTLLCVAFFIRKRRRKKGTKKIARDIRFSKPFSFARHSHNVHFISVIDVHFFFFFASRECCFLLQIIYFARHFIFHLFRSVSVRSNSTPAKEKN